MDACKAQIVSFDEASDKLATEFEGLDDQVKEYMSRIMSALSEAEKTSLEKMREKLHSKYKIYHLEESRLRMIRNIALRIEKRQQAGVATTDEKVGYGKCRFHSGIAAVNAIKTVDNIIELKKASSKSSSSTNARPRQIRIPGCKALEIHGGVLVSNRWLQSIQKGMFFLMGVEVDKLVKQEETNGEQGGNEVLQCPWGLAVHPVSRNIYVGEYTTHQVRVYSPDLKLIRKIGYYGDHEGQLSYPIGLTFTPLGHLAVVEHVTQRVQIFDSSGNHVCFIGGRCNSSLGFTNVYSAAFSWNTDQEDEEKGDIEVSDEEETTTKYDQSSYNNIVVYLADIDCKDIKRVNVGSGKITGLIRPPGDVRGFSSILIDNLGRLVAVGVNGNALYYFKKDGTFIKSVPIPPFRDYCYLARGPSDGVVVSQQSTGQILFFNADCECYATMEAKEPTGISFDADGRLIFVQQDSGLLRVFAA